MYCKGMDYLLKHGDPAISEMEIKIFSATAILILHVGNWHGQKAIIAGKK